jgi:hypothetical protein
MNETMTPPTTALGSSYADTFSKIPMGMLPFTPVSFVGTESYIAWGRLLAYGLVGYLTWAKHRNLSYIAFGAAGLSVATSISSTAWGK